MKRSSSSISCERVLPASDDADATEEFSMATGAVMGARGGGEGKEESDLCREEETDTIQHDP